MFKKNYIKSFTASLALVSGLFVATDSSFATKNFTDVSSSMYVTEVNYLNSLNVFDYKTGIHFNGNKGVTRAEAAKILHSYCKNSIDLKRTYKNNFKDVNSNTLYRDSIVWAYQSKIMDGDVEGEFNPNKVLTRAEMAKILTNTFLLTTDGTYIFKDVSKNHWAYYYINILGAEGYSVGDGKGNFMPNTQVTLNQLSAFMYRIINSELNLSGKQPPTSLQRITESQARAAALKVFSGTITSIEYDYDDRVPHYEIEIRGTNEKVDVHVNALTGIATITERETIRNQTNGQSANTNSTASSRKIITQDQAISIAQQRASGTVIKVEYERDENKYEITIRNGRIEHDFEINARTGVIISYETDYDD